MESGFQQCDIRMKISMREKLSTIGKLPYCQSISLANITKDINIHINKIKYFHLDLTKLKEIKDSGGYTTLAI